MLRDLIKLLAHWKQLLSAPEIHKKFFEKLLISHCCEIKWASNYGSLGKINHIKVLNTYDMLENAYMSFD